YYDRPLESLRVAENSARKAMVDGLIEAATEARQPRNDDVNGDTQDGFGYYKVTQRDGRRCSAAVAYLHPALGRPNLAVECGVQVERVVFGDGRAVGVEGTRVGESLRFDAAREVIVCGGTYHSPQLLMLSGIGPAEHMASRLIEPIADRPAVGRNLQDHVQLWCLWRSDEPISLAS